MGDLMLHGVLNMPLPDDPSEMGAVEWFQFRGRARQASQRIAADADRIEELEKLLKEEREKAIDDALAAIQSKTTDAWVKNLRLPHLKRMIALIEKDKTDE